jgi:hypothetical protein
MSLIESALAALDRLDIPDACRRTREWCGEASIGAGGRAVVALSRPGR